MNCVKDELFNVTTDETEEESNSENTIKEEDVCVVIKEEQSNICTAWIKTKNCKCQKIRKPNYCLIRFIVYFVCLFYLLSLFAFCLRSHVKNRGFFTRKHIQFLIIAS